MTIDDFAAMTRRIMARDGFAEYQPTACFPARRQIAVLASVPAGVDIEEASIRWAYGKAHRDEEVLVAFKVDDDHFKIVRRSAESVEHGVYSAIGHEV